MFPVLHNEGRKTKQDSDQAVLKHKTATGDDVSYFGEINKNWALLFLLHLRQVKEFTLAIDGKTNFRGIVGVFNRDEYFKRSESTYIDNPKNFFCANESSSLRRPDYKKEIKTETQ